MYDNTYLVFSFHTTQWCMQCWKLLELMKKSRGYQLHFCQLNMYNLQGCPLLLLFIFLYFVALIVSTCLTSASCIESFIEILCRNSALVLRILCCGDLFCLENQRNLLLWRVEFARQGLSPCFGLNSELKLKSIFEQKKKKWKTERLLTAC